VFAEKEGFVRQYIKPSHKGSGYEYGRDEIINVFFFPSQEAKWDGYKVKDKDWDNLNEKQKYMFIDEGTKELERLYKTKIEYERSIQSIIEPINTTARILALGGGNQAMINVLYLFFKGSGYIEN
jgi:hypothetical protein